MSEHKQPIPFIDPQALSERGRRGEKVVIVDVRTPEEFTAGHVEGAINIPSDQLAARADELPADTSIVTVCNLGGSRSCNAAELLHQMGYSGTSVLRGGVRGWTENIERTADSERA
ncbi:rhodanese-like domain-containing protein [Azotobacter salinestris]|uniref:rhodanese-like domain-containing protein n=1 Tax=Azotobacter salinestris TaxID=69964 RepID=UPI001266B725|nr:rhodanese-like domain-containing protein [Azotobacter salinestris]